MNTRAFISVVLAFLVPGAGHFYLGRRGRAAIFFVVVLAMFISGILLHGKVYAFGSPSILTTLATLGSMGAGIPYLIARLVGVTGEISSITFEYGTAFTLTAGVMNLLLVLDSYDIAEGRKN